MPRSRVALLAGICGSFALIWVVLGLGLLQLDAIAPMTGFTLFYQLGTLVGLVALVLGGVGFLTTRALLGSLRPRASPLVGVACGGLLVAALLNAVLPTLQAGEPPINDITTNLDDPPAFASDPAERGP